MAEKHTTKRPAKTAKTTTKADQVKNEQRAAFNVKRIYRSKENAMVAGVASGLAEYFVLDPAIVRLIFVLATVFGGFGVPVYIILWIILPEKSEGVIGTQETVNRNVAEIRNKANQFTVGLRNGSQDGRNKSIIGIIIIGLGLVFFLDNFGLFRSDLFWPLILVAIGLFILRS